MSLHTLGTVGIRRDLAGPGQAVAKPNQPDAGPASFGQLLVAQIPSEALVAYTTLLALLAAGGSAYRTGRWILYAVAIVVCAAAVLGSYFAQRDYELDGPREAPAAGGGPMADDRALQIILPAAPAAPVLSAVGVGSDGAPASSSMPPAAGDVGPGSPEESAALPTTATARGRAAPAPTRPWQHLPILPGVTAMLAMAVYGLTVPGSPLQYEVSGTAFGIWSGCLAVGGGVMMSLFAPFLGRGNAAEPVAKTTAD